MPTGSEAWRPSFRGNVLLDVTASLTSLCTSTDKASSCAARSDVGAPVIARHGVWWTTRTTAASTVTVARRRPPTTRTSTMNRRHLTTTLSQRRRHTGRKHITTTYVYNRSDNENGVATQPRSPRWRKYKTESSKRRRLTGHASANEDVDNVSTSTRSVVYLHAN